MPPNGPRPTARKRAADAYRLRCTGRTFQEIADALGYGSPASAFTAVKKHIERMPAEDQEQARAFSAGNYRQVMSELYGIATRAKAANKLTTAVQAMEAIANVQAKHDHLIGIEAPTTTKVEVSVSAGAVLERAEADLLALAAQRPVPAQQFAISAPVPAIVDAEVIEP